MSHSIQPDVEPSRLRLLWSAVTDVEWARVRPVSGLQRAAVIALAIAVTVPWLGWSMAASAGVAALLVGMLDLRQNPADRLRTMAVGTAFLTVTTFVARLLSPWPPAIVALLAVIAFAEGAGIAVHRDAPMVLQINGFVVATALLERQPSNRAEEAALVVLVAGSVQTLVSYLYARRRKVVREAEVAASAIDDVSVFLHLVATSTADAEGVALTSARDRAARGLSAAQRLVESSDLAGEAPMLLRHLLSCVDQMRVEGQVLVTHVLPGDAAAGLSSTDQARLEALSELLRDGADVLRRHSKHSAGIAAGPSVPEGADGEPAATFVATVRTLAELQQWQRASMSMPGERRRSIRLALRPAGLPFRFGSRLVVSSVAAGAVGSAIDLSHASWSINACLSVLRPDGGGVLPRFVLRASATAVAAAGVIAEVALIGHFRVALAIVAVAFAYLMFWLGSTNYGIYALAVTWSVLSMFAFTTPHPQRLAVARLVDTAIGCSLALVAGFLIPAWKVTQLPDVFAGCAATLSRRFTSLGLAARQQPGARDHEELLMTGIATRDAISDALSTLRAALVEPSRHVPVAGLRAGLEELRGCARLAVVAEQLLDKDTPASQAAAELAADVAATLELLSAAVRDGGPVTVPKPEPEPQPSAAEIDAVMREAADSAARAARHVCGSAPRLVG